MPNQGKVDNLLLFLIRSYFLDFVYDSGTVHLVLVLINCLAAGGKGPWEGATGHL